MRFNKYIKIGLPVFALVVANAIPLINIFFFDWNIFNLIFLYWLESAVVGFYSILKMIRIMKIFSIFAVPFFVVHYGGFMLGHLFFLIAIFYKSNFSLRESIKNNLILVLPSLASLFISHGISFYVNFLGKKEYLNYGMLSKNSPKGWDIMAEPYKRIILMHIVILLGGWLALSSGFQGYWMAILLILGKTAIDLQAHLKQHKKAQTGLSLTEVNVLG